MTILLLGTGGGIAMEDPATDPNCTAAWNFDNPGVITTANGVELLPDAVNSNDLEQLTTGLQVDVVAKGHQGDGTDDNLVAKAGGGTFNQLFGVSSEYTIIQVLKTPATITTNFGTAYLNESSWSIADATGFFFRSGTPEMGLFHFDGSFKFVTLPISLATSYVAVGQLIGGSMEFSLDSGEPATASAGTDTRTNPLRMHRSGGEYTTAIISDTYTFDAGLDAAALASYVAFLQGRKP